MRYLHYHNVGTGEEMFEPVACPHLEGLDALDPDLALGVDEVLQKSSARLYSWDPIMARGVFTIGPLPGIVRLDDSRLMVPMNAHRATSVVREQERHRYRG